MPGKKKNRKQTKKAVEEAGLEQEEQKINDAAEEASSVPIEPENKSKNEPDLNEEKKTEEIICQEANEINKIDETIEKNQFNEEINEKNKIIAESKQKNQALLEEKEELIKKVENLKNEIISTKEEAQKQTKENLEFSENKINELKMDFETKLALCEAKNSELIKSHDAIQSSMVSKEEISDAIQSSKEEKEELNIEIMNLRGKLNEKECQISLIREEAESLKKEHDSKIQESNQEIENLKTKLLSEKKASEDFVSKLKQKEEEITVLKGENENQKLKYDDLNKNYEKQLQNNQSSKGTLHMPKEELLKWKNASDNFRNKISSLEIQLANSKRELQEKQENINSFLEESLRDKCSALQEIIEDSTKKQAAMEKQVNHQEIHFLNFTFYFFS